MSDRCYYCSRCKTQFKEEIEALICCKDFKVQEGKLIPFLIVKQNTNDLSYSFSVVKDTDLRSVKEQNLTKNTQVFEINTRIKKIFREVLSNEIAKEVIEVMGCYLVGHNQTQLKYDTELIQKLKDKIEGLVG